MHFEILGEPVGEGRPRAVRRGAHVRMHAAPKSAEWRALAAQQIAAELAGTPPMSGCVFLRLLAVGKRPKALRGGDRVRRATKPDIDNVLKAAMDALVQAGAIADDTQVVSVIANKVTAAPSELPRVVIDLVPWTEDAA